MKDSNNIWEMIKCCETLTKQIFSNNVAGTTGLLYVKTESQHKPNTFQKSNKIQHYIESPNKCSFENC